MTSAVMRKKISKELCGRFSKLGLWGTRRIRMLVLISLIIFSADLSECLKNAVDCLVDKWQFCGRLVQVFYKGSSWIFRGMCA